MKKTIVISAKSADATRTLQRIVGLLARHCINVVMLNIHQIGDSSIFSLSIVVNENIGKVGLIAKKLESFVELGEIKINN